MRRYLEPLGIPAANVSFTDVCPVFFVKYRKSKNGRREQGDAIREEYDPIASLMDMPACSLHARIEETRMPAFAAANFGERLVADLAATAAPLVITLGEEVWDTFTRIPSLHARPPRNRFSELYGDAYGGTGSLTVHGKSLGWLRLVHPGLLTDDREDEFVNGPGPRTTSGWRSLHSRWARALVDSRVTPR